MRALLFGGTGQVGTEICALAGEAGADLVAPGHADLDLTDGKAVAGLLSRPWDVVINAAAYTNVDDAESDEALAFAINAEAPARIAMETGQRGIPLIHLSTDYVFDGKKGAPYVEQDPIGPLNAYGRSKPRGNAASAPAIGGMSSCAPHGFTAPVARISSKRSCGLRRRATS